MPDNTNQSFLYSAFFNNTTPELKQTQKQQDVMPNLEQKSTENNITAVDNKLLKNETTPINYTSNILKPNFNTTDINQQTSNILTSTIAQNNIMSTDSIAKIKNDVADISNKNKEIMGMDQRLRSMASPHKVTPAPAANIVNNYGSSTSGGPTNVANRSDGLAGLRTTLRSLPAWRTEMG